MPRVLSNNIQIHFERFGKGPPLLLVGGYGQNKLVWKNYFKPLSLYFDVIAFDNRGSGQTESPNPPYSIKIMVEDIIGLMEKLEIEQACFLGQSMGTVIIQTLCSLYPNKVKKAVLCAPFCKLPANSIEQGKVLLELFNKGVDKKTLFRLKASWTLSCKTIEKPGGIEQFLDLIIKDPHPMSSKGLIGQSTALFSCNTRSLLPTITQPLLLLVGERDITTPPHCAQEILENVPNCHMHQFEKMGHLFSWEIPDKVVEKTLSFLNR